VGVNIALNVVLIGGFKWIDYDAPHVALALSSTVASCVNAAMLYGYLHRQGVYRFGGHWRVLMLRYGVGNVVMVDSVMCRTPLKGVVLRTKRAFAGSF
jgi:putative peptidoglycan lipid II flippase